MEQVLALAGLPENLGGLGVGDVTLGGAGTFVALSFDATSLESEHLSLGSGGLTSRVASVLGAPALGDTYFTLGLDLLPRLEERADCEPPFSTSSRPFEVSPARA